MKICLISFDFWNYDHYIVKKLANLGIDAHHINLGALQHENFGKRIENAFSKVFFKKNIKHIRRQNLVKDTLTKLGKQDQILILNPDTLDAETIAFAKKYTKKLITYLYDNLGRYPVEDKLHFFDKIYSFDDEDVRQHGLEKLTNYNYIEKNTELSKISTSDLYYITSFDKYRNKILLPLSKKLNENSIKFKCVVVGKKTWKEHFNIFSKNALKNIATLKRKPISTIETLEEYKKTNAILDLMRAGQTGLSFRIFEAMALEKKIVTNNEEISNYDFYNPKNILILENNLSNITKSFFETPYQKLDTEIYKKYTLENWVKKVFEI